MKSNSKNTKRFWKRKNRSRSPSRSVGRSETEEVFTSSEDDISSISIDDVSSDAGDDESNSDEADDTDEEVWDEVKESVTSVTNSNDDQDLDNVSDDEEEGEECSSLASDLSWFQDHYYTTEDPRYYIISDDWRIFIYCIRLREQVTV